MSLPSRLVERVRRPLARARGWLIPAALLGLTPKCVLCVPAYLGLGAALGLGGPELCGTSTEPRAWLLPAVGAGLGVIGILAWRRRRRAA